MWHDARPRPRECAPRNLRRSSRAAALALVPSTIASVPSTTTLVDDLVDDLVVEREERAAAAARPARLAAAVVAAAARAGERRRPREVVRVGAAVLGEHVDAAPLAVAAAAAADAARVAVAVRHDRGHALRRAQPGLEEEVGVELGPAEQPEHEVPRAERDDEEAAGDGGGVAVEGHSIAVEFVGKAADRTPV